MALRRNIRTAMGGLTLGLAALLASGTAMAAPGQPVADKKPVTENFFGTSVTDDYRWMEESKSPEFQAFMKGQADYTTAVLAKIPGRDALEKRIVALDNASVKVVGVNQVGDSYFYRKSAPGAANYSLVVRQGAKGTDKVLVDPTKLSKGGAHISIDHYQPSLDGKYVAYGLSEGGSEESVLHIMDVETGKDLGETIDRTKEASVAWLPGNKAFYYNREKKLGPDDPRTDKEKDSRAYLHVIGTDPETTSRSWARASIRASRSIRSPRPSSSSRPGPTMRWGWWSTGCSERSPSMRHRSTRSSTAIPPGSNWCCPRTRSRTWRSTGMICSC